MILKIILKNNIKRYIKTNFNNNVININNINNIKIILLLIISLFVFLIFYTYNPVYSFSMVSGVSHIKFVY